MRLIIFSLLALTFFSCSSTENTADSIGVGAQCTQDSDCTQEGIVCLSGFKGGYCGVASCTKSEDCPSGSQCVLGEDKIGYCFLQCTEKNECNNNRSADALANCSSSFSLFSTEDPYNGKTCIPPSKDESK